MPTNSTRTPGRTRSRKSGIAEPFMDLLTRLVAAGLACHVPRGVSCSMDGLAVDLHSRNHDRRHLRHELREHARTALDLRLLRVAGVHGAGWCRSVRRIQAVGVALMPARVLMLVVLLGCVVSAQAPARGAANQPRREFKILRLDPALDAIVSPNAKLETLGEHFGLTEGPVWVSDSPATGHLLFSDLTSNVIYKRTADGHVSVFAEDIVSPADVLTAGQQTRSGRMATIIIGSNGLTLDRQGRVVAASPAGRVVLRFEKDGTDRKSVV